MDVLTMYKLNFALLHHHKYSLSEIEGMYPFERDIYLDLLDAHIKELEQKRNEQN